MPAPGKKSNEGAKRTNNKQPKPTEEEATAAANATAAASAAPGIMGATGSPAGAVAGPSTPVKKGAKEPKKSSPPPTTAKQESPVCVKRAKTARDNNRDLGLCRCVTGVHHPLCGPELFTH